MKLYSFTPAANALRVEMFLREKNIDIETIQVNVREDEIFKDATYHFLRHFDSSLQDFCKKASVEEIARFSNTRTARAFIVLGTVTNRFN